MKASCSLAGGGRWLCRVSRGAVLMRGLYDILNVDATAELSKWGVCSRGATSWRRWCRGSDLALFVYRARWRGRAGDGCYPNRHGRKHIGPLSPTTKTGAQQHRHNMISSGIRLYNLLDDADIHLRIRGYFDCPIILVGPKISFWYSVM
jgi:hypothetical protein